MHIAALILSILGLVLCWVPGLGVLLALIALILSIVLLVKKDDSKKTFGIIGLVIGGIGFLIGLVLLILWLLGGSLLMDAVDESQLDFSEVQSLQAPFE